MENKKLWIWVVVGILVLGGIAYLVWPQAGQENVATGADPTQQATLSEQVAVDTQATAPETATEEVREDGTASSEEVVPAETLAPTPRQELASTDPQTVNLASGDVQLVEMFAFW